MQNSFCQTFTIHDLGQPLHPVGQVTLTCHLPRDKFCKKYLSDPVFFVLLHNQCLEQAHVCRRDLWQVYKRIAIIIVSHSDSEVRRRWLDIAHSRKVRGLGRVS